MKILILDFTVDKEEGSSFRKTFSTHLSKYITSTIVVRPNDTKNIPSFDAMILSGAAIPIEENPEWHNEMEIFLKHHILEKRVPVLGICYGSQFIAKIFGAKIGKTKTPEIGAIKINRNKEESWLLKNTPNLVSYSYHYDEIQSPFKIQSTPVVITSSSDRCGIQSFEFSKMVVAGTQFHPEKTNEEAEGLLSRNKNNPHAFKEGTVLEKERIKIFENFFLRAKNEP